MKGCDSGVDTYLAYQASAAQVNRNCREIRCNKKELWIFRNILWRKLGVAGRGAETVATRPP
jgi:hypothetical protein